MLQQRFPGQKLTVPQPRLVGGRNRTCSRGPANFADTEQHLTHEKADVIFAAYGFNESFAGEAGLPTFKKKLAAYVPELKAKAFNGKTGAADRARVADRQRERQGRVRRGPEQRAPQALRRGDARGREGAGSASWMCSRRPSTRCADPTTDLTTNGVPPEREGIRPVRRGTVQGSVRARRRRTVNAALRDAIVDKDRQFFRRYRPLNTFYYTGGRNKDYGYLDFLPAMRNFDLMVANRDDRIWALAQGKAVPAKVDDSNVPPLPQDRCRAAGSNEWLSAAEERKAFKVDPRFEVNLFAGEEQFPDIANPIQMRWDVAGRLWVSCSTTYPHVYPGNEPNDKIVDPRRHRRRRQGRQVHRLRRQAAHPAVVRVRRRRRLRLRAAEPDVPEGHRRRRQGRRAPHRAHRLRHRGLAPRAARLHLDARRRPDLPRVDLPPLAGRNAVRPGPAAEQRVVPLRPADAAADQLRQLPEHQPVGRDVRRLGPARRQPSDLRGRVPRARPAVPAAAPGPDGAAGVLRRVRARVRRLRPRSPKELQGDFIKVRYKPTNRVEIHKWKEGPFGFEEEYVSDLLFSTNLSFIPVDVQLRPARRSVRLRLVQPGEGAHAVFAARRTPRPALRPHLADHREGPHAAGPAEDRGRVDRRTARTAEAARVPRTATGPSANSATATRPR